MNMIRQGDVLVVRADDVPPTATLVTRESGRIVLAHGEATGHAHAIQDESATLYELDGERYLRVDSHVTLRHEEHRPHVIEQGVYRVIRQREYTPQEIRNVAD